MTRHSPLLAAVFRHADETPSKPAVVDGGATISYAGLAANVRRAANALASLGVRRGDRIAISAQKGVEYVYFYLGAQLIGAANVVVDAEAGERRLRFIESKTAPVMCLGYRSPGVRSLLFGEVDLSAASAKKLLAYLRA